MIQSRGRRSGRGFGAAAAIAIMVALTAGCAQTPADQVANTGEATPGSPTDFVSNVGDRVYFEVDSASVNDTAARVLDRQAQWLQRYPQYSIVIEGHADERGTREYNLALGARRAEAARTYLRSRGVAGDRLRTVSFGKERPVAVCGNESCWSQNRRAVTVLDKS